MASREQIADLINDCWAYFKTSSPPPKTIESWAAELKDLDLWNSGSWITRKFKGLPDWPKNFPVAIKTFYREWLLTRPKALEEAEGCSQCMEGEGLLHAFKIIHGYKYVFVWRCGHCRTSNMPYQETTREWLSDNGYELDWQHDYTGPVSKQAVKSYYEPDEIPF